MRTTPPEASRLRAIAGAGLALVLVVVLASAAIRLGSGSSSILSFLGGAQVAAVRAVHRVAASLEVIVALWLGWRVWRLRGEYPARAAMVVLALTLLLSIIGIVGGRNPSPLLALGNVLGGLALVAAFAWLLGALSWRRVSIAGPLAAVVGALLALQLLIGARLTIFGHAGPAALPAHIYGGLVLALLLGWLALSRVGGAAGKLLFMLAVLAPAAGFTALQYEYSGMAALAHAASAAFLVAAAARFLPRNA